MTPSEQVPRPEEEHAAASLRLALRDLSEKYPMPLDAAGWLQAASIRGRPRRWLLPSLAAALTAVLLVVVVGFTVGPWRQSSGTTASPSPEASGTPPGLARFDNGEFFFDYPAGWRTLSGKFRVLATQVDTVVGTGVWRTGCWEGGCSPDTVDVSGGRIVVKVHRRIDGPIDICMAVDPPNATLGPNAVLQSTQGSATTWQIRRPGQPFGWSYNVFIDATVDSPSQLAAAEAIVASFRWGEGTPNSEPFCPATSQP